MLEIHPLELPVRARNVRPERVEPFVDFLADRAEVARARTQVEVAIVTDESTAVPQITAALQAQVTVGRGSRVAPRPLVKVACKFRKVSSGQVWGLESA